jgi:hypothetical protein
MERTVVEQVFLSGAGVIASSGDYDYVLLACRRLGTDPRHPHQRWKAGHVANTEEAMAGTSVCASRRCPAVRSRIAIACRTRRPAENPPRRSGASTPLS